MSVSTFGFITDSPVLGFVYFSRLFTMFRMRFVALILVLLVVRAFGKRKITVFQKISCLGGLLGKYGIYFGFGNQDDTPTVGFGTGGISDLT